MAETTSHRRAKQKAAGKAGRTEAPLSGGGRLDARTPARATEIERGGPARLKAAAERLKKSGARQKVLAVPQPNMAKAREAMRKVQISGTVRNISGTKRSHVPK